MKTVLRAGLGWSRRLVMLSTVVVAATSHLSCLPVLSGQPVDLSGRQVRFTFLHTSDLHSRLLPYDFNPLKTDVDLGLIPEAGPFGGAARMAALLKRERKKSDRVLHLDSGDSYQGAPIFNVNLGEVEYRFLTQVGLDAAVIGNHEFDAGATNFTRQLKEWARFPVLAANYVWEETGSNQTILFASPYTVTNIGGVRVGIIGLANIGSLNSLLEQPNSLQAIPLEQNEVTRGYVEFLRPAVDLIVLTSHAGLTEDQDLIEGYEAFYEYGVARSFILRATRPWQILEWYGPPDVESSVVRVRIPGVSGIDAILGGHLHIVLNPPQNLTDPDGRRVILSHGGAFSKYVNRIDTVLTFPDKGANRYDGAEILSYDFKVFPIDSLWCNDALRSHYTSNFWAPGTFIKEPLVQQGIKDCQAQEDKDTAQLLLEYIVGLDFRLNLTSLFAFAPRDIARRNSSTGGDSPLGNITADSMRRRQGVEAEVAITNSLGIRDNLYAGPLTQENMFNVFPFENTINIMFLSGREMQELFDFITDRSASRGCTSQAQVSGVRFTMDCAQSQLNALRVPCNPAGDASECVSLSSDRTGRAPWTCQADPTVVETGGRCFAHTGTDITILSSAENGAPRQVPLQENETYRVAVNDYIARGGSGFLVLKRNTTRVETGVPLRDSLIGYMQNFCSCEEILAGRVDSYGNVASQKGIPCGTRSPDEPSRWLVDPQERSFCEQARDFKDKLESTMAGGCGCIDVFRGNVGSCGGGANFEGLVAQCVAAIPPGPPLGRCTCRQALANDPICGNVSRSVRNYCENPTSLPVVAGTEDGRITRRIK